jgi:hypothetical protein
MQPIQPIKPGPPIVQDKFVHTPDQARLAPGTIPCPSWLIKFNDPSYPTVFRLPQDLLFWI